MPYYGENQMNIHSSGTQQACLTTLCTSSDCLSSDFPPPSLDCCENLGSEPQRGKHWTSDAEGQSRLWKISFCKTMLELNANPEKQLILTKWQPPDADVVFFRGGQTPTADLCWALVFVQDVMTLLQTISMTKATGTLIFMLRSHFNS